MLADISQYPDLKDLEHWLQEFREGANEETIVVFVANKIDLGESQETLDTLVKFAEENNIPFYKTSAKTGENVKFVMEELVRRIEDKYLSDNVVASFVEESDYKDEPRNFDNKRTVIGSIMGKSQEKEKKKTCCLGC